MPDEMNVAIMGAGAFACRYHIPYLQKRKDCRLVAISRRSDDSRKLVQERFAIPAGYADSIAMLDQEKPGAVIICTPHHLHYEQTVACLERGIPVLVEKPLTIDPAQADELVRLANEKGITLMVAYNRRVDPQYRLAAKMIQDGGIGEVRFIEGRRFANLEWMLTGQPPPDEQTRQKWWPDADRVNFRSNPQSMGEGFLDDGGTHIIDAVLWLAFASPVSVQAMNVFGSTGIEFRSTLNVQFENSLIGSIVNSGDTEPILPYEIIIHGSDGAIMLAKEEITFQRNGRQEAVDSPYASTSTTDHFIDVLLGREEPLWPARESVMPIRIARAAFESARSGSTVNVM